MTNGTRQIRVFGPDGRSFTFPEGTSPDEINQQLSQVYPTPPQAPQITQQLQVPPDVPQVVPPGTPETPPRRVPFMLRGIIPEPRPGITVEELVPQLREEALESARRLPESPFLQPLFGAPPAEQEPIAEATGALAGAQRGMQVGRVAGLPGAVTGGILGAMFGRAGLGAARGEPLREQIPEVGRAGIEEAGALVTGEAIGRLAVPAVRGLRAGAQRLFGINQSADLARSAQQMGIPLGVADLTRRGSIRGFQKVIGVFPFVAGPLRKAAERRFVKIEEAREKLLNEIAPTVTLSEVGVNIADAARQSSKEFRTVSSTLYDDFFKTAKEMGNPEIVPTTPVKNVIDEVEELRALPRLVTGEKLTVTQNEMMRFVNQLRDLPEFISPAEMRGVQQEINRLARIGRKEGFDLKTLQDLKGSIESSFAQMNIEDVAGQELADKLARANQFFAESMAPGGRFKTPTARRIERAEPSIFQRQGQRVPTLNEDQLARAVFRTDSADAIRDLRKIVGEDVVRSSTRAHLDDALVGARAPVEVGGFQIGETFDPAKFERALGLTGRTKASVEALDEMLKGSFVTRKQITDLIDIMKTSGLQDIPDPSTFVARRAVLGGAKSAARALAFGGLTAGQPESLIGTIPLLVLARTGANAVTNPNVVRWMIKAMDPKEVQQARRIAGANLLMFLHNSGQFPEFQEQLDREGTQLTGFGEITKLP